MLKLFSIAVVASLASVCALGSLSACGGKAIGVPPADGGSPESTIGEGGVCVDIEPATYDQSCEVDSDCIAIASGQLCNDGCICPSVAVNKSGEARYSAAISSLPPPSCAGPGPCGFGCDCYAIGSPSCVANKCTLCGPGSPDPACATDGGSGEGSTSIVEAGFGEAGFGEASFGGEAGFGEASTG